MNSKKLKIVFTPEIFTMQKYGGVSRYFVEIALCFMKNNEISLSILAPFFINCYITKLPPHMIVGFNAPDITKIKLKKKVHAFLSTALRVFGIFLGNSLIYVIKPSIVHETYFLPFSMGYKHTKRVITVYDMVHEKFPQYFKNPSRITKNKLAAVNRAHHIICISEATKNDLIKLFNVDPGRVSVIHLGFNPVVSNNLIFSKSFSLICEFDEPYILFVGERGGYKNFENLLSSFGHSSLLNTNFKLVCFGGGEFSTNEQKIINSFGLKKRAVVHYSGNDSLLSEFYKNAIAFVYPSLYEGFGIPPLEAMANNCPVICSNTSSIPEVVGNAGYYFNPSDCNDIKKVIEHVVSSPSIRNELVEKGKERLKFFSWEKCATETLALYKSILT